MFNTCRFQKERCTGDSGNADAWDGIFRNIPIQIRHDDAFRKIMNIINGANGKTCHKCEIAINTYNPDLQKWLKNFEASLQQSTSLPQ